MVPLHRPPSLNAPYGGITGGIEQPKEQENGERLPDGWLKRCEVNGPLSRSGSHSPT